MSIRTFPFSPPLDPVTDIDVNSGGGAKFGTIAPSKFALRALSQVRSFRFPFYDHCG